VVRKGAALPHSDAAKPEVTAGLRSMLWTGGAENNAAVARLRCRLMSKTQVGTCHGMPQRESDTINRQGFNHQGRDK